MIYHKSCPRCKGSIEEREDFMVGTHFVCLQCGHIAYPNIENDLKKNRGKYK